MSGKWVLFRFATADAGMRKPRSPPNHAGITWAALRAPVNA